MEKVLIVTYYWPPAGGPGVQRWLKFAKYLKDFDIEPVVYVPQNAHYPLIDVTLEEEVPLNLKVIKKPIVEPYSLANLFSKEETSRISSGIIADEKHQSLLQKIMLFVRGNFFIPDARKYWVKPSVNFLSGYMQENGIKTVITTGPPHSIHLIGLGLKKDADVRWFADFRDPWTSIGYHKKLKLTKFSKNRHKKLERNVVQKADHIITTSFTTKDEIKELGTTPISVITNGYDVEYTQKQELDIKFSLAHIGSLLSGRDPGNLWKAIAELISEDKEFAEDFELKLIGTVGEQVLQSIKDAGLINNLAVQGYVSHTEALKLQRKSQMLLLIEIDSEETKGIIPGKLFEYMVSQRPIVAMGPEGADLQKILTETNTGKFFTYSKKEEIKHYLLESYKEFKVSSLTSHPIGLQKYSRKALTGKLAKLLQ